MKPIHLLAILYLLTAVWLQTADAYKLAKLSQHNFVSSLFSGIRNEIEMNTVLFVEAGFGCDQHGQNSTKAVLRACRNAIEFNSLPALRNLIPGGKQNMVRKMCKLRWTQNYDKITIQIVKVKIAVPAPETVDIDQIYAIFPYGKVLVPEVIDGGMRASSGIALPEFGDTNDDMIIAVAVISVGY